MVFSPQSEKAQYVLETQDTFQETMSWPSGPDSHGQGPSELVDGLWLAGSLGSLGWIQVERL